MASCAALTAAAGEAGPREQGHGHETSMDGHGTANRQPAETERRRVSGGAGGLRAARPRTKPRRGGRGIEEEAEEAAKDNAAEEVAKAATNQNKKN